MSGRQRRRLREWEIIRDRFGPDGNVAVNVTGCDPDGVPVRYEVEYRVRSICGIDEDGSPVFAGRFLMDVVIPEKYPQADAPAVFRFKGDTMPWHPNIVYDGDMAGTVCVNQPDTFADIAWAIDRVESYLRYDLYHARHTPPFPADLKVARWVRECGEPLGWVYFDQN